MLSLDSSLFQGTPVLVSEAKITGKVPDTLGICAISRGLGFGPFVSTTQDLTTKHLHRQDNSNSTWNDLIVSVAFIFDCIVINELHMFFMSLLPISVFFKDSFLKSFRHLYFKKTSCYFAF